MTADLDKRIAVEVMGEGQPNWRAPVGKPPPVCVPETSQGGAWWRGSWNHEWRPLPFSSDINQALRAVDKYFADRLEVSTSLHVVYCPTSDNLFTAIIAHTEGSGYGQTLPEAICNLLLALVVDDKTA